MRGRRGSGDILGIIAALSVLGPPLRRGFRANVKRAKPEALFGVANAERAREKHRQKLLRRLERWNGARA